jgi:cytochrome c-type biogenesis protein CcmH
MLFWPLFALMTGAAVFAVLWPLGRARAALSANEADLAVYRDQLGEIDRDRRSGMLPEREAEAARTEVSRRLLAAADRGADVTAPGAQSRRRIAALAALAGVPLFAFAVYAALGSPGLPDAPLQARLEKAPEQQDVAILVRRIETHLAGNPNDARGWEVLAPIYLRLGRAQDAVNARSNIVQLRGADAARLADLGEAMVAAADGAVRADAKQTFDRALGMDKANAKARFFLALAAEQDGRKSEALDAWRALASDANAGDSAAAEGWRLAAARRAERLAAEVRAK